MDREEEIDPGASIRELQVSISAFSQILGSTNEYDSNGSSTADPLFLSRAPQPCDNRPILRHTVQCDNCNRLGHRWMHCPDSCIICGKVHPRYLYCGAQDKKRIDDGEGDDKDETKRMRKGTISK